MKYLSLFLLATGISISSQAKIWRVNNTPGVVTDFTELSTAVSTATAGDSIYLEGTGISYSSGATINKQLVIIGPGYLLDAANSGNGGLQATPLEATFTGTLYITAAGAGSKIMGLTLQYVYLRGTANIVFERVRFTYTAYFDNTVSSNITFRKCLFSGSGNINEYSGGYANGLTLENNIIQTSMNLNASTGSNNIIRNNNFTSTGSSSFSNVYFTNNIVSANNGMSFTNCTIKNNIFASNQQLPITATDNLTGQNMADVYEGTGSLDGRYKLKAGSPAIGKGLTVGSVVSPDCGAFGATDPYVLSGIPPIPTIYTFTAPTSIPSGTATMNVTFSTRNNN